MTTPATFVASDAQPVRFAILSPAWWGRLLLDAVKESQHLRLAGVWSRNPENAAGIVRDYGGRAHSSYEALLADDEIEAVVLPTPHFLHYPQAMTALAAGKHVFVEKPIANHVSEALEMQRASEARGLVLGVGLQGRRTGGARKVKQLLTAGELGQVALAVVTHGSPRMRSRPPAPDEACYAAAGVGSSAGAGRPRWTAVQASVR